MPAARPGFQITSGKWTSIEGSASISDVQANSVFVLTYEESGTPLGDVTLSVTNGSASISNPVPFNSLVTVTADAAPGGQVFAGWEENGVVVSYSSEYSFTALTNRTIVATYAASVTPQPIITMSNVLSLRSRYQTFIGQYELAGNELIEYGFIYHPTDVVEITLETSGIVVAQSYNRQANTNEFVTSFLTDSHKSMRAYLIYDNGVDNVTVYSENATVFSTTAAYPAGAGTTNMAPSPTNNASTIGLDPEKFNVLSIKGGASVEIGLNNAGQIRLYSVRATGNGNTLQVSIGSGYKITSVEFVFGASTTSPTATLTLGSSEILLEPADLLNTTKTYTDLDITTFSLKNTFMSGGSTNAQIYLLSINITYVPEE